MVGKADTEMCPVLQQSARVRKKYFLPYAPTWNESIHGKASKRDILLRNIFIKETLRFVDRTG